MCGGSPPIDRIVSTSSARTSAMSTAAASSPAANAWRAGAAISVSDESPDRLEDVGRAGKDRFFEHRRIGDRAVEGGHARDRGVEMLEQFLRDAGGDLGAEPAGQLEIGRAHV